MTTNVSADNTLIIYEPENAWFLNDMTTTLAGATAEFSFDGSFVLVFGTIPPRNETAPISTFSLDGTVSFAFDTRSLGLRETGHNQGFSQSSPDLLGGLHTLIINSTQAGAQFTLGSIIFAPSISSSISAFPSVPTPASNAPSSTNAVTTSQKIIFGRIVGGILSSWQKTRKEELLDSILL
ncbi:hypothetical protein GYMLUDRAFT_100263 [Collybiopsis luxurians FD-317 M1]|uniref:Uncharacterized protein n=1 Tax=Collybiopsis luxurians FD-317 M1 TaxID=944289 RepID=A0A0D0C7L5_9AGAR|nr:hypothetical protein GYMLUDRAFT_100263 [Collybiopsis luxurians FD-317 M1]